MSDCLAYGHLWWMVSILLCFSQLSESPFRIALMPWWKERGILTPMLSGIWDIILDASPVARTVRTTQYTLQYISVPVDENLHLRTCQGRMASICLHGCVYVCTYTCMSVFVFVCAGWYSFLQNSNTVRHLSLAPRALIRQTCKISPA